VLKVWRKKAESARSGVARGVFGRVLGTAAVKPFSVNMPFGSVLRRMANKDGYMPFSWERLPCPKAAVKVFRAKPLWR